MKNYINHLAFTAFLKSILAELDKVKYDAFTDKDGNIRVLQPYELLKVGRGTCWDQALYTYAKIKTAASMAEVYMFYIMHYMPNAAKGKQHSTHTGVIVKDPATKKYVWVEHAWEKYKGLHEFNELEDAYTFIKDAHKRGRKDYLVQWNPKVKVDKLFKAGSTLTDNKFLAICGDDGWAAK